MLLMPTSAKYSLRVHVIVVICGPFPEEEHSVYKLFFTEITNYVIFINILFEAYSRLLDNLVVKGECEQNINLFIQRENTAEAEYRFVRAIGK